MPVLFSLTAERGTLRPVQGSTRNYILTLREASNSIVWFSDRPTRRSGFVNMEEFLDGWADFGFDEDPPNVALTVLSASGATDTVVATMHRPSVSGDSLTSRIRVLTMEQAKAIGGYLTEHGTRHDLDLPRRFTTVALFIDDATVPSCIVYSARTCL